MWVIASSVAFFGAYMIYPNEGWGWFLFAGIIVAGAGSTAS